MTDISEESGGKLPPFFYPKKRTAASFKVAVRRAFYA